MESLSLEVEGGHEGVDAGCVSRFGIDVRMPDARQG